MKKEKRIVVVTVPSDGDTAYIDTIDNELEAFQKAVGGMIETLYCDFDGVIAIINEEGKYLCRPNFPVDVLTEYGLPGDVIFGNVVFVLDKDDGEFHSLTDEVIEDIQVRLYWLKFVDRRSKDA